jgi:hypothetical protein
MKKRFAVWIWMIVVALWLAPLVLAKPYAKLATAWAREQMAYGKGVPYESWKYEMNVFGYFLGYLISGLSPSLVLALSSVIVVAGLAKLMDGTVSKSRLALVGLIVGAFPSVLWSLRVLLSLLSFLWTF